MGVGSFSPAVSLNFSKDACALLEHKDDPEETETQVWRVQLLGNLEYIFVDEYQDVAEDEYRLIQLIAGLGQSEDENRSVQINLCAIGDDDQNIYEFRNTSLRYIIQFETEYKAKRLLLTENYRSTEPIIAAVNALIQHNQQRCKRSSDEQVRINSDRQGQGGPPVLALQFNHTSAQAVWICQQVQSWLEAGVPANEIVILAHDWKLLSPVRALLEQANIFTCPLKDEIPLIRNWVACRLIGKLREAGVGRILDRQESVRERFYALFQAWKRSETEPTVQTLLKIGSILDQERNYGEDEAISISAADILTALFEFNRSGRSFAQDNSVLVSSCHGVKGLEFRKVILLTDRFKTRGHEIEAERRLFYVAMTRAKAELVLCSTHPSQFVQETGRSSELVTTPEQTLPQFMLYLDLTPEDINLGYSETKKESNQAIIRALREGDPLMLTINQWRNGWELRTTNDIVIGSLSRNAVEGFMQQRIHPNTFQFQSGEVTVRSIYRHLKVDQVTTETLEEWFVVIPQIRVCRS